jgi:hypothetical protein
VNLLFLNDCQEIFFLFLLAFKFFGFSGREFGNNGGDGDFLRHYQAVPGSLKIKATSHEINWSRSASGAIGKNFFNSTLRDSETRNVKICETTDMEKFLTFSGFSWGNLEIKKCERESYGRLLKAFS